MNKTIAASLAVAVFSFATTAQAGLASTAEAKAPKADAKAGCNCKDGCGGKSAEPGVEGDTHDAPEEAPKVSSKKKNHEGKHKGGKKAAPKKEEPAS